MSEARGPEDAGSPVEETAANEEDVRAAVKRAQQAKMSDEHLNAENDSAPGADATDNERSKYFVEDRREEVIRGDGSSVVEEEVRETEVLETSDTRPEIADHEELPSALAYKERSAAPDTEPYDPIADEQAAQDAVEKARKAEEPETIQVEKDHPMAALYLQAPTPPELYGNRGAGILISLLGAIIFAAVYAGIIALGLARHYPPSTFVTDGLLPHITSIGFIASAVGFFVGMVILVLFVGRAGWWAYVLGGFWVAVFVWAAATVGYGYSPDITGLNFEWDLPSVAAVGSVPQVLAAALVAREVAIWFGAWIGRRGRKMTARNREAIADYEAAVAESKSKSQVS
ncbi:MAG: hypothetical protein ACTHZN_06205 [Canibacter sp.]